MDIQGLQAILSVNYFKNYADAANYLSVSTSTLSKQISMLEDELGITVFTRATKSKPAELTAEGKAIITSIQSAVSACNELSNQAKLLKQNATWDLNVGYVPGLGAFSSPMIMGGLVFDNDSIRLHVKEGNSSSLLDQLQLHTIDVAFLRLTEFDLEHNSYIAPKLYSPDVELVELRETNELFFEVNVNSPLAQFDSIKFSDLNDIEGVVILFNLHSPYMHYREAISSRFGLSDKVRIQEIDYVMPGLIKSMVVSYDSVAAPIIGTRKKASPETKFVRIEDWDIRTFEYYVALRSNKSRPVRILRKHIDQYI